MVTEVSSTDATGTSAWPVSLFLLVKKLIGGRRRESMRSQTPLALSNIHGDSRLPERVRAKRMVRVRGITRHLYGDENYLELEK